MKTCVLLGDRSEIAQRLMPFLKADGWTVHGWNRDSKRFPNASWDLCLSCLGRVAPVGKWSEQHLDDVADCINSNLLLPLELLRTNAWHNRKAGASVCFMAGSNPQRIMVGYLPYNMSKMALLKAVEQIDYESPDCKVFALAPGYVRTKIHKATLDANWPNERIARGDDGTPIERIWECLKWCIAQDKEVVGGRNICVSDGWDKPGSITIYPPLLSERLRQNPAMFKLRRVE